jgi:hypothetical protein
MYNTASLMHCEEYFYCGCIYLAWPLQHVRVVDKSKLRIYPTGTDKSKLQLELHNLKSTLPKVIVKVTRSPVLFFSATSIDKNMSL